MPWLTAQAIGQPTLGSTAFRAPNPPFGATVTYHLPADITGPAKARRTREKKLGDAAGGDNGGGDMPVPDLDTLWNEHVTADPAVVITIRDSDDRTGGDAAGRDQGGPASGHLGPASPTGPAGPNE